MAILEKTLKGIVSQYLTKTTKKSNPIGVIKSISLCRWTMVSNSLCASYYSSFPATRFSTHFMQPTPRQNSNKSSEARRDPLTGQLIPPGFDFTWHMRRLCEDICRRHPRMCHIDMSRVAVAFSQTRKGVRHGIHASLTPMRFEDGAMEGKRRGRLYRAQRLFDASGVEMLYILKFYLPRFQNESFEEKLTTIFHELWHISGEFNGDIRRHSGRCYVHTSSEKEYDRQMLKFAREWLQMGPGEELYQFVQYNFRELQQRFGKIIGVKVPQPKLIPIKRAG